MSDPTGPYNDPRPGRTDRTGTNTWTWVAGIIALFLIVFFIFAYGNRAPQNSTATSPTGNSRETAAPQVPQRGTPPPSTTGQGNR